MEIQRNKTNENYLLKANAIIQGYVVEKLEKQNIHNEDLIVEAIPKAEDNHKIEVEDGKIKVNGGKAQTTLTFTSVEYNILNIILKRVQENIFYTNIENYKNYNPFSITFKDLKKSLEMKNANYVQEIHTSLMSLREKGFILKNFIHPNNKDENGNFIKYKAWYSSIITEFGYRTNTNSVIEDIDKISANDVIDLELSSLFKFLLQKPVEKNYYFEDYEKFKLFAKKKNPFISEEQIKEIYNEQKKDKQRQVSYTVINHSKTKQIRSVLGKRLFEELHSRISYQVNSKKTVSYNYLKLTLQDFNLIWGKNETGMKNINKFFRRRTNWDIIKQFLEEELPIENLEYESYNNDKFIEFTFSPTS